MYATLALEDGTLIEARGFGAEGRVRGELVFNTSHQGFQESLTDPSYQGQILMLTAPMVANYGADAAVVESDQVNVRGFAVHDPCPTPNHHRSQGGLDGYLRAAGIPGIAGLDTRSLTRRIREHGTLRAVLVTATQRPDGPALLAEARGMPAPDAENLVSRVSIPSITDIGGIGNRHLVVLDTGVKASLLRDLQAHFRVTQVPWDTPAEDIRALRPDGLFLSNGPGDPSHPDLVKRTVPTIAELGKELPTMGVCLGHQLLALANGGQTFKLRFGHRGGNQPVRDITGKVRITAQNHGYAVQPDRGGIEVTEINVNDGTVEGLRVPGSRAWSVQYHPEAAPGPLDSKVLFARFAQEVKRG